MEIIHHPLDDIDNFEIYLNVRIGQILPKYSPFIFIFLSDLTLGKFMTISTSLVCRAPDVASILQVVKRLLV